MLNKFPGTINDQPEVASPDKAETGKSKEEMELIWQKELASVGKLKGVNFEFVEPKLRLVPEKLPSELNWNLFASDISEEEREKLNYCFQKIIRYLNSPIITDNFPDHHARRDWEKENLGKMSSEAQDRYNHNRLGLNFASHLNKLNFFLNEDFKEQIFISREALNQLNDFFALLPRELRDGEGERYASETTAEKIKTMEKLAPLMSGTLRILGQEKIEQAN